MKSIISFLLVIFLFNSCVFRHTDDTVDLGNNYYFLADGRMSTIGFNTANEGENRSGITLVEPKVVKYNFNDKYIIAKTIGVYDNEAKYWIIDKDLADIKAPENLDSISFYNKLLNKKIDLELK